MTITTAIARASSRRVFLAMLVASAAAPSALAQTIAPGQPLPPTPVPGPNTPPDSDIARLAAGTDVSRHLTVDVLVNGKGPFHFVVDTGAELSVLADNVAREIGLANGEKVMVDGISRRIAAEVVKIDSLSFGPFTRTALSLPVLPRQFLAADGFLGLDVIDGSRVTFDFRNHVLQIEQPKTRLSLVPDSRTSTHLRLSGTAGQLHLGGCYIDGVRATAFIDSGAEVSVGNLALRAALGRRHSGLSDLGNILLTGVTGGEVSGLLVPISSIHMQDITFASGTLVIADVPNFDSWSLRDKPALLIGMDFLRQFAKVAIDYRSKEIRFELSQIPGPVQTMARV